MSETAPPLGAITWHDLTVADAPRVRDFYKAVVGLSSSDVSMGDYADFAMHDASGAAVAGVCHARGPNTGIPPQWLVYFNIADLDRALQAVADRGGKVVHGPRSIGPGKMAVVQDPAGAVCALYQAG